MIGGLQEDSEPRGQKELVVATTIVIGAIPAGADWFRECALSFTGRNCIQHSRKEGHWHFDEKALQGSVSAIEAWVQLVAETSQKYHMNEFSTVLHQVTQATTALSKRPHLENPNS